VMSNNKQEDKVIPSLVLVEDSVVFQALKDFKINLSSKAEVVANSMEIFLMNLRSFLEVVNKEVKEEDDSRLKEKTLSSNVK